MPRLKKDPKALSEACCRFTWLMEKVLKVSAAELARQLGYANATTLQKVKRCKTFPDVERLQRLGNLSVRSGGRPNLDWLITGEGKPVLLTKGRAPKSAARRQRTG